MITMIILLVILVITFIFILGAGLVFLQMFNPKKSAAGNKPGADAETKPALKTGIRWSYFILPVIILLLSVIITIYFYGKLPHEMAYRFSDDGTQNALMGRNRIVLWAIVPQLLLTLLAMVITYGTGKISALLGQESDTGIKMDTVLMVMSNMVVIPQLVLIVAMLNIFSYNSFQTHISFIWWVSLAIIFTGIVFLSIFFINTMRKMRNQDKKES